MFFVEIQNSSTQSTYWFILNLSQTIILIYSGLNKEINDNTSFTQNDKESMYNPYVLLN